MQLGQVDVLLTQARPWALAEVLRVRGACEVSLVGRSMMPLVAPGARLPVVAADASTVRAGDVVVIERGGQLVTHRAIRRGADGRWVTRGDASPSEDTPVDGERILAKVAGFALGQGALKLPRPVDAFLCRQLAERGSHVTRLYLRWSRVSALARRGVGEAMRVARGGSA